MAEPETTHGGGNVSRLLKESPELSLETLELLKNVLGQVSLSARQADFADAARLVVNAHTELAAAIESARLKAIVQD